MILVAVLGVVLLWAALRKGEPTIRDNSVLTLRVAGTLPDYSPDDPFKKYFGGPDQSLTGLDHAVQESEGRQTNQGNPARRQHVGSGLGQG